MKKSPDGKTPFNTFPLADADQCVKCGLCLPHCPTYKLTLDEGNSPRGRIALMQALATGLVSPASRATEHLDGCLVCRACEPVCPARVPYGRLIDRGREGLWNAGERPGFRWRLLQFFRMNPLRIRALDLLLRIAHRSGLSAIARRLPGKAGRMARLLRTAGTAPRASRRRATDANRDVQLFLGCVARPLDHAALNAAVRVLNAMQFNVDIPREQGCCGAMDSHAGDRETAAGQAKRNLKAFRGEDEILSTASGCGVQLQEYGELLDEEGRAFGRRVHDVMHFIAQHADRLPSLRPLSAQVVVHMPCTLRNGMRESGALALLQQIPQLAVRPLHHQDCCGAAGSYLFEQPETADALGKRLLDALGDDIPDILVTSNTGCALHLERLARERGRALDVRHPVELLADALDGPAGK